MVEKTPWTRAHGNKNHLERLVQSDRLLHVQIQKSLEQVISSINPCILLLPENEQHFFFN